MNLDYLIRKTFCSYFFHRILFHVYIPMYQVKGLKINTIFHYIDIFIIFMLFTYFTYFIYKKKHCGREVQEGGDVHILMADSCCCMAETNTTL